MPLTVAEVAHIAIALAEDLLDGNACKGLPVVRAIDLTKDNIYSSGKAPCLVLGATQSFRCPISPPARVDMF